MTDYKKLYEQSQKEIQELTEENQKLEGYYEEVEEERFDLQQALEKLKDELEELKGDHEELTKENQKLEEENTQLDEKLYDYVSLAHKYTEDGSADQLREHLESVSRPHPSYMLQTTETEKMDYKKLYEQSLKQRVADEKLIKKLKQENEDLQKFDFQLKESLDKSLAEIKELKEEVIVERKKVIEEKENRELAVNCWTAEARFLNMDSAANQEPEEFNEFLKEEYDEEMYKKMYDEFDLKELLACARSVWGEEEDDEEEEDDSTSENE